VALLRELTNVDSVEDFSFLNVDGMIRETNAARSLATDPVQARLYGIKQRAGITASDADDSLMDSERVVMIAVNWDEDAIFLDYRRASNPTVMVSQWSEHSGCATCHQIAASFEDFARHIGLLSAEENKREED